MGILKACGRILREHAKGTATVLNTQASDMSTTLQTIVVKSTGRIGSPGTEDRKWTLNPLPAGDDSDAWLLTGSRFPRLPHLPAHRLGRVSGGSG